MLRQISQNIRLSGNLLLCLLSSFLLVLAFPKTDIWILAWAALVPFFIALRNQSLKGAFCLGWLWGILFFAGVFYWFIHVTVLGAALIIFYLALFPAFFALMCRWLERESVFARIVYLPSGWVLLEFVRSNLFTGFGWAGLGHSQYQNLAVIQIADITGVYGVSFLVVMVNVLLGEFFAAAREKFFARRREIFYPTIACALLIIFVLGYGYARLKSESLEGKEKIKVALIQASIPQEIKWNPASWPFIMEKYLDLTKEAAGQKPDLIVWPETAFPGFLWEAPELFADLKEFVSQIKIPLLLGIVTQREESFYNTAVLIGKNGNVAGQYDKLHLVPFGEYIPLRKVFPFLSGIVQIGDFTPGKEYTLFSLEQNSDKAAKADFKNPGAFAALICFEDTIPYLARGFAQKGAQLFINITNDAWFKDTKAPFLHLQSSVFQAVANRRSLIRAANTGVSCFINSDGKVTEYLKDGQGRKTYVAGYEIADTAFHSQKTFYTKYGDFFTYLCFGAILWKARRQKNIFRIFLSKRKKAKGPV